MFNFATAQPRYKAVAAISKSSKVMLDSGTVLAGMHILDVLNIYCIVLSLAVHL